MGKNINKRSQGRVVDICDSIVSVSGLTSAFNGELVRFKSPMGEITGFV
jgi:F0F1-type ATP synthase alpha subunit